MVYGSSEPCVMDKPDLKTSVDMEPADLLLVLNIQLSVALFTHCKQLC